MENSDTKLSQKTISSLICEALSLSQHQWLLVRDSIGGNWETLYCDGYIVYADNDIRFSDAFDLLGIKYKEVESMRLISRGYTGSPDYISPDMMKSLNLTW